MARKIRKYQKSGLKTKIYTFGYKYMCMYKNFETITEINKI